jgi:hypothetical protein
MACALRRPGTMAAAALLAALSCAAARAEPPRSITLHYAISYNGATIAEGSEALEHDGRTYRLRSETRGKGLLAVLYRGAIKRTSKGAILPSGLRPFEFTDQRGDRAAEIARFDWAGGTVFQERSNGHRQTVPAERDMQDRLSFLWNFSFAAPQGRELSASIVDGRGTTRYRYEVAGRETLKTPAGSFETVRLVKQQDPGDARGTQLWLAAERNYIPVRVLVIEKDGTRMDTVLMRIGS